jgi:hypothetical protein
VFGCAVVEAPCAEGDTTAVARERDAAVVREPDLPSIARRGLRRFERSMEQAQLIVEDRQYGVPLVERPCDCRRLRRDNDPVGANLIDR